MKYINPQPAVWIPIKILPHEFQGLHRTFGVAGSIIYHSESYITWKQFVLIAFNFHNVDFPEPG